MGKKRLCSCIGDTERSILFKNAYTKRHRTCLTRPAVHLLPGSVFITVLGERRRYLVPVRVKKNTKHRKKESTKKKDKLFFSSCQKNE